MKNNEDEIIIKDISKQKKQIVWYTVKHIFNCEENDEIQIFGAEKIDKDQNIYVYLQTKKGNNGYIKISKDGRILAKFRPIYYLIDKKWEGNCNSIGYIENIANGFDNNENIYLVQLICCHETSCAGKIRIIKLLPQKGV